MVRDEMANKWGLYEFRRQVEGSQIVSEKISPGFVRVIAVEAV